MIAVWAAVRPVFRSSQVLPMAIKATIYKAQLNLADMDRNV